MAIITLTTDFGTVDGYAAAMKGVILTIAPEARVVDLTHDVPSQDIRAAAFALHRAVPFFPPGTIHCAVVDPGVGTARRPLLMRTAEGQYLVGPDSGIFTLFLAPLAHREPEVIELTEAEWWRTPVSGISATFHGRDVFAPVAAHLSRLADHGGIDLARFGRPTAAPVRFEVAAPAEERRGWRAEVVSVDHFGNAITNLPVLHLTEAGEGAVLEAGGQEIPVVRTYADVGIGDLCALIGSSGWLEIAERDGSAADRLGLAPGIPVFLRRTDR